ncbi:hypothetical protein QYM36_019035 [Artemia franciscana]|uniref:DUF4371 domain-containing protein n=1 Tax=Artemia franciscana TaxID=6661 RepID=A0AA88HBJ5_ARTSF|nr:hypothetical protein QYM36_019035 [Artemia franciscana]
MRSKGVKPGMLVTHFQSNGHKASVGDLISFVARYKPLPYLVDKEKLKKNIESEKEKERGRCIKRMLLDITTAQGKQGLVFCGKDHEGGNYVELANLLSRHNTEMNQWISKHNKPSVTSYLTGCSQDELIAILGTELVQRIFAEVNEAHFFGMFADGTPAVGHEECLALGVRYVDIK